MNRGAVADALVFDPVRVTDPGSERALAIDLNTWNYSVSLYPALRSNGFGVRCVRDN
jgi:hypothetical protein